MVYSDEKGHGNMKNKKKRFTIAVVCMLFLALASIYSVPKLRTVLFVKMYYELIEENLKAGNGVPAEEAVFLGYKYVNSWDGSYPMTEFVIMTYGDTYYGCYYSPDDVPLAFQNTEATLKQTGKNTWKWEAEGDNHGSISRIMEHWYYFNAAF